MVEDDSPRRDDSGEEVRRSESTKTVVRTASCCRHNAHQTTCSALPLHALAKAPTKLSAAAKVYRPTSTMQVENGALIVQC